MNTNERAAMLAERAELRRARRLQLLAKAQQSTRCDDCNMANARMYSIGVLCRACAKTRMLELIDNTAVVSINR